MEKLNETILERGPEKRKISLWKSESNMSYTVFHEIIRVLVRGRGTNSTDLGRRRPRGTNST